MSDIPPSVPPSYTPPPGGGYAPPPPPAGGSSDRTLMLVLSYLGILALIPLLMKKEDPEVQWHAKNGLAMSIAFFVFFIVFNIIAHFIPFLGCALAFIPCIVAIGWLAVTILAIMKAINGERFRLPVISDFADKM